MPLDYLPIMAQSAASKQPRVLVPTSRPAWCPVQRPVNKSRVALLTSAAMRLAGQPAFMQSDDLSYRIIPSDPAAGELVIDHHSRIGAVPRQDPEIVFPRSAVVSLARRGLVGGVSPFHIAFMGGVRRHEQVEFELAPAIVRELKRAKADLVFLVPY